MRENVAPKTSLVWSRVEYCEKKKEKKFQGIGLTRFKCHPCLFKKRNPIRRYVVSLSLKLQFITRGSFSK